jgi:hypothetical protein
MWATSGEKPMTKEDTPEEVIPMASGREGTPSQEDEREVKDF